jgi:alpha-amylase/alpha-mannosidase (GH57 family)
MIWANFLHIYQPPTQKPDILAKVVNESYRKLVAEVSRTTRAKLTLNINGVLTDLLIRHGFDDVISDIRRLSEIGQIELTGSAKYHPLLPKLPKVEAVRQIKLNHETNKKYFGRAWNPKGFFPPEMGFSMDVAKLVQELGFEWIIVDEFSYPKSLGEVDYSKIYKVRGLPLNIYFRERGVSFKILSAQLGTGNLLLHELGTRIKEDKYLLTAMDGETFGHHRLGLEQLLMDLYRSPKIHSETISELPRHFRDVVEIDPEPSTWALTAKDVERKSPFSRWFDPDNPIHKMQWELTELALDAVYKHEGDRGWQRARHALDRSLHSDQYWWAGAKPWWSIEYIERGAKELMEAIALTPNIEGSTLAKSKALYFEILSKAFDWQREGVVDQMSRAEDEEVRQRVDANLPNLAMKEFERMIVNLRRQMLTAAKNQEYERAGQFRDRISELEDKQLELKTNRK